MNAVAMLGGVVLAAAVASARGPGPDIIVSDIHNTIQWGVVGGVGSYSIGTTSCNVGDADAAWFPGTNEHPVIAQNIYRISDGRFVHLGLSWVKHGFFAVNGDLCALCPAPGGFALKVGCSDPYDATLNGEQFRLGPRSDVNPYTGEFPFPYTIAYNQIGIPTYKRAVINGPETDPTIHVGARFFAEGQYVARDDSLAGNQMNNASYREMLPIRPTNGAYDFSLTSVTVRELPAIYAWRDVDPQVQIEVVDVPGDGRMHVASRVYDQGDGTWRYEYVVHNMNSHRSASAFTVPVPAGVTISQAGFRDVEYHSGEPYSSADWQISTNPGEVHWNTESIEANADANAIRWGTLYNFWFHADQPPIQAAAAVGLFRPGTPSALSVNVSAPSAPPPVCIADANGDGLTNGADLSVLLTMFGEAAEPAGDGADFNADGMVNGADLSVLLFEFGCGT